MPTAKRRTRGKPDTQLKGEIVEMLATSSTREGAGTRPWEGTESIERRVGGVNNMLVGIYLDGVAGVSPNLGRHQVSPDKADAYLRRGREVLAELVAQRAPAAMRGWHQHRIWELRDLLGKAQAVRDGVTPQKMTTESYEELRRSLQSR